MYGIGWVRFLVASALLAGYGVAELLARVSAWRDRPPRVRRPLWSHLLGFVSMLGFYGLIGTDGRAVLAGHGNSIGVALAVLAMVLRFTWRRGGPLPEPDLVARMLLFAALPLAVGSPRSVIALTVPQLVVAMKEASQRGVARGRIGPTTARST